MLVSKKNLFFLPIHEPSFREHLILAKWVKLESGYNPIFIISNPAAERFINILENEKIEIIKTHKIGSDITRYKPGNRITILFYNLLKSSSLKLFFDYIKTNKKLKIHYKYALEIIEKYKPAVIFLTGDRHLGFELPLIKAANISGIKTIIIPISYSAPEGSFKIRYKTREYRTDSVFPIFNWLFFSKKEMQKQIYSSPKGKFAFYNAGVTLALYKNKMLPKNPWVMGGGNSDIIAVDGVDAKERYIKLGIPKNKIVITGHQSYDILFQHHRNKNIIKRKIYDKYLFDRKKKIIILGMPQLAEHGFLTWSDHWKEIEFLVSKISSTGQNLLLSLHPKSNLFKYRFLEKKYNCKISEEPLVDILVAADCYIATFSSTIQWTILCGIPAIVVDFYGFNYNVFDKFQGVVKINKKDSLEPAIKKILTDENYYKTLQRQQKEMAEIIAPFDGKSCQRIIELVDKICIQN